MDPAETAPKLTARLFGIGSQLLLRHLPGLLDGTITPQHARQQDESEATHAPKVRVYAWVTTREGQRLVEVWM